EFAETPHFARALVVSGDPARLIWHRIRRIALQHALNRSVVKCSETRRTVGYHVIQTGQRLDVRCKQRSIDYIHTIGDAVSGHLLGRKYIRAEITRAAG